MASFDVQVIDIETNEIIHSIDGDSEWLLSKGDIWVPGDGSAYEVLAEVIRGTKIEPGPHAEQWRKMGLGFSYTHYISGNSVLVKRLEEIPSWLPGQN